MIGDRVAVIALVGLSAPWFGCGGEASSSGPDASGGDANGVHADSSPPPVDASSSQDAAREVYTGGDHFGSVELLPSDPSPPTGLGLSDTVTTLSERDLESWSMFCQWLGSLARPTQEQCATTHEGSITSHDVVGYCHVTVGNTTGCVATLEQLVACSVDIADCATRVEEPRRCAFLLDEACGFDLDPTPATGSNTGGG